MPLWCTRPPALHGALTWRAPLPFSHRATHGVDYFSKVVRLPGNITVTLQVGPGGAQLHRTLPRRPTAH